MTSNSEQHHHSIESESPTRYVCTSNHGFSPYAQEELRRRFGSVKSTVIVPGEVFVATLNASADEVYQALIRQEPMFLRHLFRIEWEFTAEAEDGSKDWLPDLLQFLQNDSRLRGSKLAVHTRKSEHSLWNGSTAELRDLFQQDLSDLGSQFVVREADYIISVFVSKDSVYAGIAIPEHNLSDWNGGMIRFQREEGQISRAKFKLLEAESVFGIDFSLFHEALDIGAAPGGWTSFLLDRGLKVTAVDPAKLHADVLASPRLTYIRKNANSVTFSDHQFDLLVCDMSWSPKMTAKLVTSLLYALKPGGTAVITVKLLGKKPMALIQEVIEVYQESRLQVQRAKQLFHNREEITLYMVKY